MLFSRHFHKQKQTLQSIGLYFIVALILSSSIATIFAPQLSAKKLKDMSLDEQVKSLTYYGTLTTCFHNEAKLGDVTTDPSTWFTKNNAKGYIYPNGSNTTDCKDIASTALELWGWGGNHGGFLEKMGYTKTASGYHTSTDKGGLEDKFILTVQGEVYPMNYPGNPPLSGAANYVFFSNRFNAECKPQDVGIYSSLNADQKKKVDGNETEKGESTTTPGTLPGEGSNSDIYTYSKISIVDSEGKSIPHGIKYLSGTEYEGGGLSNSIDKSVIMYGYHNSATKMTCKDLANSLTSAANDFALYKRSNPSEPIPGGPSTGNTCTGEDCETGDASTCRVDGIGWIICPVMTLMANVVDAAYGFVAGLLTVQPLLTSGDSKPIYDAWSIMRSFANVAFVIAFLIIIFSQLTSIGMNNYGIKKMLPRLIIAAILVNVSYWICAIAVDISNILGASLNSLMGNLGSNGEIKSPTVNSIADGTGWLGITGAILAGAGIATAGLYVGLSALIPALISAAFAILAIFLVLTLRQALIVLLIVISPLAFVAFLLPNTESLFKKWKGLFQTLLLMYPIIAFIFGTSAFASVIVMNSANGNMALQVMGALIAILPLALTPLVMKTAGGLLNRFGGFVNNPNKGPFDKARKGAESFRKRQEGRREIRAFNGRRGMSFGKYNRTAKREAVESGIANEQKRARASYVADKTSTNESFRNSVAGGDILRSADPNAMDRAQNAARDIQAQIEVSEIKASRAQIDHAEMPNEMLQAVARGQAQYADASGALKDVDPSIRNTESTRLAAIQKMTATGQAAQINELIDQYGGEKTKESRMLADTLQTTGSRPGWIGQGAIEQIGQGQLTNDPNGNSASAKMMSSAIKSNAYSPDKFASADADELKLLADRAASDSTLTTEQRTNLSNNAKTALTDPLIATKLGKRAANVEAIALGVSGVLPHGPTTQDWSTQQAPTAQTSSDSNQTSGSAPVATPQSSQATPTVLTVPHDNGPTTQPINVTVTSDPIVVTPPANVTPPTGRRSSGAPFDSPGNSARESSGTRAVIPPDESTNTDINRFI